MLKIKPISLVDNYQEYNLFNLIPKNENGFKNEFFGVSYEQYSRDVINILNKRSLGIGLRENQVPSTFYVLWLDNKAIGLFIFNHRLNDFLKNGSGHISFYILKEYRNRGYATKGLGLLINKIKDIVYEDEIYMSCNKLNKASLKVQLRNGAKIYHQDKHFIYTKIPVKNNL